MTQPAAKRLVTEASLPGLSATQNFAPSSITYNPDGTVATVTENGVLTALAYDSNGQLHTETRLGKVRTWSYDSNGLPSGFAVTDAA